MIVLHDLIRKIWRIVLYAFNVCSNAKFQNMFLYSWPVPSIATDIPLYEHNIKELRLYLYQSALRLLQFSIVININSNESHMRRDCIYFMKILYVISIDENHVLS